MNPNASLKSANSNLREIASRPLVSLHSGSPLSAAARAAPSSFFIANSPSSQWINALGCVNAPIGRKMARKQRERTRLERPARIERVIGNVVHHRTRWRAAQPRQGDMRRIFAFFGGQSQSLQSGFDFALQMLQRVIRRHAGP